LSLYWQAVRIEKRNNLAIANGQEGVLRARQNSLLEAMLAVLHSDPNRIESYVGFIGCVYILVRSADFDRLGFVVGSFDDYFSWYFVISQP
jgi:hypothetical protein